MTATLFSTFVVRQGFVCGKDTSNYVSFTNEMHWKTGEQQTIPAAFRRSVTRIIHAMFHVALSTATRIQENGAKDLVLEYVLVDWSRTADYVPVRTTGS